jgi:hypothetical protein
VGLPSSASMLSKQYPQMEPRPECDHHLHYRKLALYATSSAILGQSTLPMLKNEVTPRNCVETLCLVSYRIDRNR